jgi:biotin operon repressor
MSKLKEIKQTKDAKKNYNHPIIELLLSDEPVTKEEIGEKLHITSDRVIRDVISICSMHYPVIAVSSKKGYRRAKAIDNLEDKELQLEIDEVEHQLRELKSRVDCLNKRMKPLVAWLKVAQKKLVKEEA